MGDELSYCIGKDFDTYRILVVPERRSGLWEFFGLTVKL